MDLSTIVGNALGVALIVLVPIAGWLAHKALSLAELKFGIQVSAADEAAIDQAVAAGAGVLRAKLAGGLMTVPDLTLNNAHVDQAAQAALDVAGAAGLATNITKVQLAARIVGAVGHALGNDVDVPSVATATPVKSAAAAMGLLALVLIGGLSACSPSEQATAVKGAAASMPCLLAIQDKVALEPNATDAQKAIDAASVATTNASCIALNTDAATLVQQATAPATTSATTTTGTSP